MSNEKTARTRPTPGTKAHRLNTSNPTAPGLFPRPVSIRDRQRTAARLGRLQWMQEARDAAWRLIHAGHTFDAHAITEAVGRDFPGDGRRLAEIIRWHARRDHIQLYEYTRTRRPTSGAVVAVWEPTGKGRRAAAERADD